MSGVTVKVAEARISKDVGRNVVRVGPDELNALKGVCIGDLIKIIGKKSTAAMVMPAFPEEVDLKIIRMDKFIRENCGVELNEQVTLEKIKLLNASSVTLEPVDIKIAVDNDFIRFVKDRLLPVPVKTDDLVTISMLGHIVLLKVKTTTPGGIVKITPNTNLKILGEPSSTKKKIALRLVVVLATDNKPFECSNDEKILTAQPLMTKINDADSVYGVAIWLLKEL